MERYRAQILEVREEVPGTTTYILENPEGHSWTVGANTHVALPGFDSNPEMTDKGLVHHMSIMTCPEEGKIGFTTRFRALPSRYKKTLKELKAGDEITIFKTKAHMDMRREDRNVVCLSMGVAIATFRPFIMEYMRSPEGIRSFTLVSCDREGSHIFSDLLMERPDIQYRGVAVTGRKDFRRKIEELANVPDTDFYIAGSEDMMVDTVRLLQAVGVDEENIFLDRKPEIARKYLASWVNIRTQDGMVIVP